jgi:predicted phosphatase
MIVIDNEAVSMFDVDETLVLTDLGDPFEFRTIKIINPYDSSTQVRRVHKAHVQLLKQMHGRGRMVGVWSGGGVQWVRAVVQALGLEKYVDVIMTKPIVFVDDMPVETWMNNRVYIKANTEEKT